MSSPSADAPADRRPVRDDEIVADAGRSLVDDRRRQGLWIIAIAGVAGLLLRIPVVFGPIGYLNSDEAFTGLMAREIADGHLLWIFPGQSYQGTLEAFAAAAVTPFFGPSAALLKLVSAGFWFAAAILIDLASRRIMGSRPGVAFAVVWLMSGAMVVLSANSLAGYGAGLLCCSFGYWMWGRTNDSSGWRVIALAGLGFGAAVWQAPTFLPTALVFLGVSVLVPAHRTIRRLGAFGAGMLVGVLPLVAFNAAHEWSGLDMPPAGDFGYVDRLRIVVTELLPRFFGMRLRAGSWTLGATLSILYLAFVVGACAFAAVRSWTPRPLARPIAVLAVANVILLSGFSTTWYAVDARYAISFVPVVALLLAWSLSALADRAGPVAWVIPMAFVVVLAAATPIYRDAQLRPPGYDFAFVGDANADAAPVIDAIGQRGLTCALGDYWTAPRIAYLSGGDISASAEPPSIVRLREPYDEIARQPGRYVRIAPVGFPSDTQYAAEAGWQRLEVAGTAIYVPSVIGAPTPGALC